VYHFGLEIGYRIMPCKGGQVLTCGSRAWKQGLARLVLNHGPAPPVVRVGPGGPRSAWPVLISNLNPHFATYRVIWVFMLR